MAARHANNGATGASSLGTTHAHAKMKSSQERDRERKGEREGERRQRVFELLLLAVVGAA